MKNKGYANFGGGGGGGQIGCAMADVQVAHIFFKFAFQDKSEYSASSLEDSNFKSVPLELRISFF